MSDVNLSANLLKGLSYNLPIEGAIRTGYVVQRGDKRLPARDDEFSITLKHKDREGWVPHPLDAQLRENYGVVVGERDGVAEKKLRQIPVVIAFDNPDLTVSEQYAAFNREGRPLCRGNGATARRRDPKTGVVTDEACPGPEMCAFGIENRCDAYVRAVFQIDGYEHDGAGFVLRSGSFNAVSDLRASLEAMKAMFGGKLAGLPMWLTLEGKSSAMSKQSTFWYASLRSRSPSRIAAANAVKDYHEAEVEAGIDRSTFEATLVALNKNGGMGMAETSQDAEQIEDLLEARYLEETDEGLHTVTLGARALGDTGVRDIGARLLSQAAAAAAAGGTASAQAEARPNQDSQPA